MLRAPSAISPGRLGARPAMIVGNARPFTRSRARTSIRARPASNWVTVPLETATRRRSARRLGTRDGPMSGRPGAPSFTSQFQPYRWGSSSRRCRLAVKVSVPVSSATVSAVAAIVAHGGIARAARRSPSRTPSPIASGSDPSVGPATAPGRAFPRGRCAASVSRRAPRTIRRAVRSPARRRHRSPAPGGRGVHPGPARPSGRGAASRAARRRSRRSRPARHRRRRSRACGR